MKMKFIYQCMSVFTILFFAFETHTINITVPAVPRLFNAIRQVMRTPIQIIEAQRRGARMQQAMEMLRNQPPINRQTIAEMRRVAPQITTGLSDGEIMAEARCAQYTVLATALERKATKEAQDLQAIHTRYPWLLGPRVTFNGLTSLKPRT